MRKLHLTLILDCAKKTVHRSSWVNECGNSVNKIQDFLKIFEKQKDYFLLSEQHWLLHINYKIKC